MPDPGTITAAVSAIKSVVDLAGKVNQTEIRVKLQEHILDLQSRLLELPAQIAALQEEKAALAAAASVRDLTFKDGMYWDGDDGPFCPSCVDGEGKRSRVSRNPANGFYVCAVCDKSPVGAPRPRGWDTRSSY